MPKEPQVRERDITVAALKVAGSAGTWADCAVDEEITTLEKLQLCAENLVKRFRKEQMF